MGQVTTRAGPIKKTHSRPHGLEGRKLIKCPHCGELLMDVDREVKVELYSLPARKHIRYEKSRQCDACGGKAGYNLKPAMGTK